MSPLRSSAGSAFTDSTSAAAPAGSTPDFVASPPRRTWTNTARRFPDAAAARSSRRARSSESTVSTTEATFTARFALFDWIGPMRWPAASGGRRGNFSSASWTRFSPNARTPAAWARSRSESGYVFPTATRRTLSGARPLRAAAAAIRRFTSATRAAISPARVTVPSSPRHRLARGCIERAVREGVGLVVLLARHVDDAEAFDPARLPPRLLEECPRDAAPSCGTRRRTAGGRAGCRPGSRRPARPLRARGRGPRESRATPPRCSSWSRASSRP